MVTNEEKKKEKEKYAYSMLFIMTNDLEYIDKLVLKNSTIFSYS
jgi:hypothetical protein